MDLFNELIPFARNTDLVYLQGWGEPLLHDEFFKMVRICKDLGIRVGFTTNGMLLTEDTIRKLVDLQLDILGVSLAGTTAGTHNRIRRGTDFQKIVSSLELIRRIKSEKKAQTPAVHLAYLMLKSNFHELEGILPLAKRTGASQIVASNLTLILDPGLHEEAIFNDTMHADHYRLTLDEIQNRAAGENIVFDYHGPGLDDTSLYCRENVHRACVVNVDGEVVPCVIANPVLCENREQGIVMPAHCRFNDQSIPLEAISFGNIRDENLTRIWRKRDYAGFRNLFNPMLVRKRDQALSAMPKCCVTCYKRLGA